MVSFTPRPLHPQRKSTWYHHLIGGWVGPRAVLDAVVKRKIPSPRWESNSRSPIVQPVAQRYTDWTVFWNSSISHAEVVREVKMLYETADVGCQTSKIHVNVSREWERKSYPERVCYDGPRGDRNVVGRSIKGRTGWTKETLMGAKQTIEADDDKN
jgi:hypothetical protein